MAKERDRGLEAALVAALHSEADSLPFTIRPTDVRTAAGRRSRFRWRDAWLLGAAALVVAVGALVLAGVGRQPAVGSSPSPLDPLAALPSYDRLVGSAFSPNEIMRGEGFSATAGTVTLPGTLAPGQPAQVVLACTGPDLALVIVVDAERDTIAQLPCTGGLDAHPIPGAATRGAASAEIAVEPGPGTAWRAIVVGGPMAIGVPAGTDSIPGLPSFDDLAKAGTVGAPVVARGSGLNGDGDAVYRISGLGGPSALEIVFACRPGSVELAWSTGPGTDAELGAPQISCPDADAPLVIGWRREPATAAVTELHVHTRAGTAWEALIRDVSSTSPEMVTP